MSRPTRHLPGKRKEPKLKPVSYQLIQPKSLGGAPMYALLDELITLHHEELVGARIALAWNTAWQPDADGRVTLGKCKKATDLDRELAAFDFVIILRKEFWEHLKTTALMKRALLDHELMHATVKLDEAGEPMEDERGRKVYRMRRHDLEEFADIAARYGCWKKDIEAFASALDRGQVSTADFIGPSVLQQLLMHAGLDIPLDAIAAWTAAERREAKFWSLLKTSTPEKIAGGSFITPPPAHVAAAVQAQPGLPIGTREEQEPAASGKDAAAGR